MATKIIARRVKHSCLNSSHTSSPSFHSFPISSSNGSRNTSISFPGCFGLWISIDSIRYFRFIHSHERMLRMDRTTSQVLCELLMSPNGFIPSVLNVNLTFIGSSLASIRGVSKHLISFLLHLFKIPTHQFQVPRVREQTLQACDHRHVPHDHSRNFPLLSRIGSSVLYLGAIIFIFTVIIAFVSAPLAHRACIIVFILLPV